MPDHHAKVQLRQLPDMAAQRGVEGIEARFAREALDCAITGLSLQRLAPNFRQPFGHRHSRQEELFVIVGGSGRAKVEDEIVELETWDVLRVSPGATRQFEAGPDGMELLAFGAPTGERDSEMLPGWWS